MPSTKNCLTTVFQCAILGTFCLFSGNTLANPTPSVSPLSEDDVDFKVLHFQENSNLLEPSFSPLPNGDSSTFSSFPVSHGEKPDLPTCSCAADLKGVSVETSFPDGLETLSQVQDNSQNVNLLSEGSEQNQPDHNPDQWYFKFQPYVTIPVSTYGKATVRGRTVNYNLSLGQLLQSMRVTASGRFEAWKGRWGFIVDGYFISLSGIKNIEGSATRIPNTINALNYLLSKDVNTKAQEIANTLNQDVEKLRKVEALRDSGVVQTLGEKVQNFKETIARDAQALRELEQKINNVQDKISQQQERLQEKKFEFEQREGIGLNEEEIKKIITLSNQDLDSRRIAEEENLDRKIQTVITGIEKLESLEHKLRETRDILEQTSQKIKELRAKNDGERLQKLETEIENTKALLSRDIQAINEIKDFQENRLPQQLGVNSSTDLQFEQGIYDFAISYHIGALPMYELPETPSRRPYPLLWFQPIAGVRLNNINLNIDEELELKLSSSLVNFEGTFQKTYSGARTWFEPMLGGKVGLQLSDPITLWVRGDVSGFGLAGDVDLSWNVLFGMDWWVRRNISLQLAYRFYEINYQNGSGNNAFGFQESFNGPYLSATFNF